ncbi:peptide chain release factor N(5)-glutamine methyltransferase [Polynucleobacter tropicus]|uniref:Release factor glutamine methyltransferase n=1 Tax=Polynucleobacter tropicus TaxID=1743174 RepID=A0A6M9Q1F6_9BURK|nr:peptide chain release factor N(5)-glutamine methyltransferase [Polynucleobacter tropicus]QKM63876.1 peptide chain release factor N(5)-glutamine methyltransferase [Polynucleobacter tropicus]
MSKTLSLRSLLGSTLLPRNEAYILMAHVLDKHYQLPRSTLISRDEIELSAPALEEWHALESRRLNGEPVAYLVGKRGFHKIELQVTPGVLIPRPETELLVDIALQEIKKIESSTKSPKILDLGTGSGAIALAIANEALNSQVIATDQSLEALTIAKSNAKSLGLETRVQFTQGSWYQALKESVTFDIIVGNPPYIPAQDPHLIVGDLRFEPLNALTDHSTGLSCLEAIVLEAKNHLKPMGLLAVEHGYDQSNAVVELMKTAGLSDIQTHQDLSGHHRVASARKQD